MKKKKEIYVDYALNQKIGIWSTDFDLKLSFKPKEKINWQIEGEALAIKYGLLEFLKNRKTEEKKLIIYTDNQALLGSFFSETMAGIWWNEAIELAEKNYLNLELEWVSGKNNPADKLTRSEESLQNKKSKWDYVREWKKKIKIGKIINNFAEKNNLSWKELTEKLAIKKSFKSYFTFAKEENPQDFHFFSERLTHPTEFSLLELEKFIKILNEKL